jgi:integrase
MDEDLVEKAVKFGKQFAKPGKKTQRLHRAQNGPRMFEAHELRTILARAKPQMRAMILLGINCGFGNSDVSALPQRAVNLETGWIDFPRPKTGIPRRCPLWPETVTAIREALARRVAPKDPADEGLVFLTSGSRNEVFP